MAAVTTALAAGTALAGLGMNIAQYAKANKAQKDAASAASAAANQIANIKEQNPFSQVQVPTLGFDLAQQGLDRSTMSALSAAQGAGAEGVIGAAGNIVSAQNAQNLDLAAQADQAKYQRDAAQAAAQGDINARKSERDFSLGYMKLAGAQQAAATAQENKANAIAGMFGSATSALGYANDLAPLYGKNKKKTNGVQDTVDTGITAPEAVWWSGSSGNTPINPYGE